MHGEDQKFDAIIIGGGFYGCMIALHLATRHHLQRVILVEQEADLFNHASYNNQARIHNGYHYPRSFTTAYRSRINLPRFIQDWPQAVKQDFTKVYAIARRNSKVTAKQFHYFCKDIGAKVVPAPTDIKRLFESKLIEDVFLVEEYAFDASKLASWAKKELAAAGVCICFKTQALAIRKDWEGVGLQVEMVSFDGDRWSPSSRYVFNCTYSGLNQLQGDFPGTRIGLKHELTEITLVAVPSALQSLGITVMDGPFFSVMPFPARDLHSLSHVRYTPHLQWYDQPAINPYKKLQTYDKATRVDRMLRDAMRYLPALKDTSYVESLFEIKTVLLKNEGDDGRPILFEKHYSLPGLFSVLGGKIDNIYDILEKLDAEFS